MVPSHGGSSHHQNCNSADFFLSKNKFRLSLGCREDGFAVFVLFTPAEWTEAYGAWPVFRVQKCAGPNRVGKHQPLQWRRALFLLCLLLGHKPPENSEVIFRSYFLPCSSLSVCIILLKNKSSSVHEALDSLQLACWYLTHCCELEGMLQNLLQSSLFPPFGVGKGRKRRGSFNQVLTIT